MLHRLSLAPHTRQRKSQIANRCKHETMVTTAHNVGALENCFEAALKSSCGQNPFRWCLHRKKKERRVTVSAETLLSRGGVYQCGVVLVPFSPFSISVSGSTRARGKCTVVVNGSLVCRVVWASSVTNMSGLPFIVEFRVLRSQSPVGPASPLLYHIFI
jgi:hypothetical protein